MRTCSLCKIEKPLTDFGKHKNGKDGLRSRCKPCNRLEAREYHAKNPTPGRLRGQRSRKKAALNLRDWLRDVKAKHGCCLCAENEPLALDFHHVLGKDISVTSAIPKGAKAIEAELAKCVVVCANCHRKVHAGLRSVEGKPLCQDKFPRSAAARVDYYKPIGA